MDIGSGIQTRRGNVFGALVTGFYAWVITIAYGAVLLDVTYARSAPAAALSEGADFLLLLSAIVVFAAIPAIGFAWKARTARYFFIASLMIVVLEFLAPAFLAPLLQGLPIGTTIRIVIGALASILAFIGLNRFYQQA